MNRKLSMWGKIKAYKLHNSIYAIMILFVFMSLSIWVYIDDLFENFQVATDLALAFATSLLATIFMVLADVYVKYKMHQNDQFLEGVHEFGIDNLHFNKQELLERLLEDCDKELWISGYRLILTSKITDAIMKAIKQGAKVRILVSPPWLSGFQSVYGLNDRVMDNYCKVFSAIVRASADVQQTCEVRFTSKPLFNDTYKVDQHLITGPYMHNRDEDNNRITANDFFTYDLIKKSRLYQLVEKEYLTIWDEAEEILDWNEFAKVAAAFSIHDLREQEKIGMMQGACVRTTRAASEFDPVEAPAHAHTLPS